MTQGIRFLSSKQKTWGVFPTRGLCLTQLSFLADISGSEAVDGSFLYISNKFLNLFPKSGVNSTYVVIYCSVVSFSAKCKLLNKTLLGEINQELNYLRIVYFITFISSGNQFRPQRQISSLLYSSVPPSLLLHSSQFQVFLLQVLSFLEQVYN